MLLRVAVNANGNRELFRKLGRTHVGVLIVFGQHVDIVKYKTIVAVEIVQRFEEADVDEQRSIEREIFVRLD